MVWLMCLTIKDLRLRRLSNDSRTIPWIIIKFDVDYILVSTCIQMYKKQGEVKWMIN